VFSSLTLRRASLLPALAVPLMALTAACGSGSATAGTAAGAAGGGTKPELRFAYFKGDVAGPESVVATDPGLSAKLDVRLELVPVDSGVAGIAQIKGGAFPGISGVGNPPAVAAIGKNTPIEVVFVESLDSAGLVTDGTITTDDQLVGQKIGALVGSTLDFELRGWLKSKGLTDKVTVVSFQSEAALSAAYKSGNVHAAYISQAFLLDLKAHGGRVVVTAADIARLGYAALGLLVVTQDYAKQNPTIVQQLVCTVRTAQQLELGPDAARYITPAARLLGVKPEEAIAGTKGYPYVPDAEQLSWFTGTDGQVTSGKLAQNFRLTGEFLVAQKRLDTVPTAADLAAHIDPRFVQAAYQQHACA
jgi:taurine transport system substrate-binding protein